jgi:hypothetical protein
MVGSLKYHVHEGSCLGEGYAQVWKRRRVIEVSLVGHVSGSNMLAQCSSIKSKGSTIEGHGSERAMFGYAMYV